MRSCDCEDYKRIIDALNGEQDAITLDSKYFLFCPWCGVRLNAPCAYCEELSNKNTGKTIYWQEEENYCTVECGLKMMKGGVAT